MSFLNLICIKLEVNLSARRKLYSLGIICSIASLCGCASTYPLLNGSERGTLIANAVFKFDEPPKPIKDVTSLTARDYGFSMNVIKEGKESCFVAHNRRESPVSVSIIITVEENLASDREFPFYYVVPPNTDTCIARLFPLDKSKDYAYRSSKSWMVGDYTAQHYPREGYRVPWAKGESYTVTQAPDGPLITHFEPFSRNAIDFAMPVGTPVHAARSGIVVGIADSFTVGGFDRVLVDKANYVDILHDDGTIATYAHFAENSLAVRVGQRVSVGEKLALSGSTGYSSGPHLHFSVWKLEKTDKGFERVSLPVEFCFDGGPQCIAVKYHMTISTAGIVDYAGETEKSSVAMMGSMKSPGKTSETNTASHVDMDLVAVKGGCFQKPGPSDAKTTKHKSCVNDFYIGKYEVTQRQWQQVMGSNPAHYKQCGPDCPVENVSWDDVQEFIKELNKQTGKNYRLPTEDEWEFAARSGGKKERYPGSDNVDAVAWYKENSGNRTHLVGQKQPNGLSLYDMSGNVMEWVADWWTEQKQPTGKRQGISREQPTGSFRLMRGGSWRNSQQDVLITLQGLYSEPSTRSKEIGFRLAESQKR